MLRKRLGLHAVLAAIAAVYWVLHEHHGDLYRPFCQIAAGALPWFSLGALPCIAWVDRRMAARHDAYGQLGDACWAGGGPALAQAGGHGGWQRHGPRHRPHPAGQSKVLR